jgi:hypothetical protein
MKMTRSPRQYSQRPVPEEFIDYMFVRIGKSSPIDKLESWWDSELAFQRHNDCPPYCTDFETHQHPELKA